VEEVVVGLVVEADQIQAVAITLEAMDQVGVDGLVAEKVMELVVDLVIQGMKISDNFRKQFF
jgi:hypothetical protein